MVIMNKVRKDWLVENGLSNAHRSVIHVVLSMRVLVVKVRLVSGIEHTIVRNDSSPSFIYVVMRSYHRHLFVFSIRFRYRHSSLFLKSLDEWVMVAWVVALNLVIERLIYKIVFCMRTSWNIFKVFQSSLDWLLLVKETTFARVN